MRRWVLVAALVVPGALAAQQAGVRARLLARGLPVALADGAASVAADATARGLPVAPLEAKALEGWAKQVPAARILAALQQFVGRMGEAREAVRGGGLASPPGEVIAAAAEAIGRGIVAAQISQVVRAAPQPGLVAPGLLVAAALMGQGLGSDVAVRVVAEALRHGESAAQLLDIPSAVRAMQSQGLSGPEIGRRMIEGAGLGPPGGFPPGLSGAHPPAPIVPPAGRQPGNPPPGPGGHRPPHP
jgi:hypothetical protein